MVKCSIARVCTAVALVLAAVFYDTAPTRAGLLYLPRRPADATAIMATTGTVLSYVVTDNPLAAHLIVRDDVASVVRVFEVARPATLNRAKIDCSNAGVPGDEIAQVGLCRSLPGIVPGARVVLVYWATDSHVVGAQIPAIPGSGFFATDAIWTVPKR